MDRIAQQWQELIRLGNIGLTKSYTGAAFHANIEELGQRMDKGFDKLKALFANMVKRLRNLEQSEAGIQLLIESNLSAVLRRIDEYNNKLRALELAMSVIVQDPDMEKNADRMGSGFKSLADHIDIAVRNKNDLHV